MKVLVVYWHPDSQRSNGPILRTAHEALESAGREARVSDLHAMRINPVSDRANYTTTKDRGYFKPPIGRASPTEVG
jgi:NAD(P)H dehydrogenase (quinone)